MTKLAHHFTLLYYKMLIKGNYCAIMQLKLIIPVVHFGEFAKSLTDLLPKIDSLLPDDAESMLIVTPAMITAATTQAAAIFMILRTFFLSIDCSVCGM